MMRGSLMSNKFNFSHYNVLKGLDDRLKVSLTEDVSRSMVAALRAQYFNLLTNSEIRGSTEFPFMMNRTVTLPTQLQDSSIELFPHVSSTSRKALELRLTFYKSMLRSFGKPELDDRGMSGPTAYAHDASKVMSVPGVLPNMAGAHPKDNSWHRHELGLRQDWVSKEDEALAICFFDLIFGVSESTPVRIPGASQSVLPMMLHGKGYKTLNFVHAVYNLEDVYALAKSGTLARLQELYDITFCYVQGHRTQPDAAGKVRKVIRRDDANESRYKEVVIDNSVHLNGISEALTKHFATVRYRYVWGMCNTVNSIINCVGGSCREVYGKIYEFTFKHRSIEHMRSKMRTFDIGSDDGQYPMVKDLSSVFLDVTSFDRAMLFRFVEVMINKFKGTPFFDFVERSAFAPLIVRSNDKDVDPDNLSIFQNGDPLNFRSADHRKQGLLSGWGWVSDAGKWAAFVIYLVGIKAGLCQYDVSELDSFLKGKHPLFCCFNLGDDNVVMGRPEAIERWEREFKENGYWVFDYEPGCRFIGHIFHHDGQGRYKISNDPVSAITNILTPERSWQSKLRRYPAHGIYGKLRQLDAPFAYPLMKLFKECYFDCIGHDFDAMIQREMDREKEDMANDLKSGSGYSWMFEHRGKDLGLRETIISDMYRDDSVLRWKYSAQDLFDAFGVDITQIEARPDVWFSGRVLQSAGYRKFSDACRYESKLDNSLSGIWIHNSENDVVNEILESNASLYISLIKDDNNV